MLNIFKPYFSDAGIIGEWGKFKVKGKKKKKFWRWITFIALLKIIKKLK